MSARKDFLGVLKCYNPWASGGSAPWTPARGFAPGLPLDPTPWGLARFARSSSRYAFVITSCQKIKTGSFFHKTGNIQILAKSLDGAQNMLILVRGAVPP